MSQATLEAPSLDAQFAEAEASQAAAAEYDQQAHAAAMPEMVEAPTAQDPNDFLGSRGLGGYRDQVVSNPNNPNMQGTLAEAVQKCPAFGKLIDTLYATAGEGAVVAVVQGYIKRNTPPEPEASKTETAKPEKDKPRKSQAKAEDTEAVTIIETPVVEAKPAPAKITVVETPVIPLPVAQKTGTAKPVTEAIPKPEVPIIALRVAEAPLIETVPGPVSEPSVHPQPEVPASFFAEPEPVIVLERPPAEAVTIPLAETPEPVTILANNEILAAYAAIENEASITPLTTEPESATELGQEVTVETAGLVQADILPAEPVDLSQEVQALLIELGLNPNTVPEPDYSDREITTSESIAEQGLQLPEPIATDAHTEAEASAPIAVTTEATPEAETRQELPEELPVVLQTALVERIETLSVEQIADVQPVADALLEATVAIDEIQLQPAANPEQQAERLEAAEQKLEELCVDLLQALGLPADDETVKQLSHYLVKTEQFRRILRMNKTELAEEGTHERLRSSLAWLKHLIQFMQDELAARHHALGWSALRLSAPRLVAA
jgi:hypothetical protein